MNWKQLGWMTLSITLINLVGMAFGDAAKIIALPGLVAVALIVGLAMRARWRRRIRALEESSDSERQAALDAMTPKERSVARLVLGEVSEGDAVAPPDGIVFRYQRTPRIVREGTFWLSVVVALIALGSLALGIAGAEWPYAAALGAGFTLSAGYQLVAWDHELRSVILTSSGLQQLDEHGTRSGLLWSEIAAVVNRAWLGALDFYAYDGRRVRVGANLVEFTRFCELMKAHLLAANPQQSNEEL